MSKKVLRIKKWETHFEGAKSKTYNNKSSCTMPCKHNLGYKRLVKSKNGAALFGAWCALIQVLSRHDKPRAGYLTHDGTKTGTPYTSEDLEILCDIKSELFTDLLEKCKSEPIAWVEVVYLKDTTRIPQETIVSAQYPLDSNSNLNSNLNSNSIEGLISCIEDGRAAELLRSYVEARKSTKHGAMSSAQFKAMLVRVKREFGDPIKWSKRFEDGVTASIAGGWGQIYPDDKSNKSVNEKQDISSMLKEYK